MTTPTTTPTTPLDDRVLANLRAVGPHRGLTSRTLARVLRAPRPDVLEALGRLIRAGAVRGSKRHERRLGDPRIFRAV